MFYFLISTRFLSAETFRSVKKDIRIFPLMNLSRVFLTFWGYSFIFLLLTENIRSGFPTLFAATASTTFVAIYWKLFTPHFFPAFTIIKRVTRKRMIVLHFHSYQPKFAEYTAMFLSVLFGLRSLVANVRKEREVYQNWAKMQTNVRTDMHRVRTGFKLKNTESQRGKYSH